MRAQSRHNRTTIRAVDGSSIGGRPSRVSMALSVRLRQGDSLCRICLALWKHYFLRVCQSRSNRRTEKDSRPFEDSGIWSLVRNAEALHQSCLQVVSRLRRSRNQYLRSVEFLPGFRCGYGRSAIADSHAGTGQQQPGLYTGQLQVVAEGRAVNKPEVLPLRSRERRTSYCLGIRQASRYQSIYAVVQSASVWICGACLVGAFPAISEAQIPRAASQYKREIIAYGRLAFGLSAPTSLFAGQIHQESRFQVNARSKYASGLGQFTDSTAVDVGRWYPDELGDVDVFNPSWSIRALTLYDKRLWDRVPNAATECDRAALMLSQYNGGPGWTDRDSRLAASKGADRNRWFGHVERFSSRAAWAFKENRTYPRNILLRWMPMYHDALWGPAVDCKGVR